MFSALVISWYYTQFMRGLKSSQTLTFLLQKSRHNSTEPVKFV